VENTSADLRRERRIAGRRQQIIEAAARLFAEKGFHRATTRDIADAADVSEGTLYNYFSSKDELLMAIMEVLSDMSKLGDPYDHKVPDEAREFLVEMMLLRRETVDRSSDMLQSVLSEILVNPELRRRYYTDLVVPSMEMLTAHLDERIEQGQLRPINVAYASRVIIALLLGLYVLEVLGDPVIQPQWEELSQFVASVFIEGARPAD